MLQKLIKWLRNKRNSLTMWFRVLDNNIIGLIAWNIVKKLAVVARPYLTWETVTHLVRVTITLESSSVSVASGMRAPLLSASFWQILSQKFIIWIGLSGAHAQRDVSTQTPNVHPVLIWCWASVSDAGPTPNQHSVNIWAILNGCSFCDSTSLPHSTERPYRPTPIQTVNNNCYFIVGPPSQAADGYWINTRSTTLVCGEARHAPT